MQREDGAASVLDDVGSAHDHDNDDDVVALALAVSFGSAISADKRSSSLFDLFLNTPVSG